MESKIEIDESLYSRQLYVFGCEAQKMMASSNVLIIGMNGLGVEIAKNITLAGVKSVALHDDKVATWNDLSAQFFLTEADLGSNRAHCSRQKLAELNPYVQVTSHDDPITDHFLAQFAVVVVVAQPWSRQVDITERCRRLGVKVIVTDARGVFGTIFCDFGSNFRISDATGEPEAHSIIAGVIVEEEKNSALITTVHESLHNLVSGDHVVLSDIEGITGLNGETFEVTVRDLHTFEISLANKSGIHGSYVKGGLINQVKRPVSVSFRSFAETIDNPGMFQCDPMVGYKIDVLHLAFRAMYYFEEKHNRLPAPGNQSDAREVFNSVLAIAESLGGDFKVDKGTVTSMQDYIESFARCCSGVISPMCAVIGGIAGQEVLKACSGKFMPIMQWFYHDSSEALPVNPLPAEEVAPMNCRYDSQIAVFGRSMQQNLSGLNMFIVGAGAIGCEMLKTWAMMGIATGESNRGVVHVTDPDHIEKSNLSRQFLFRSKDIDKSKSLTAANSVVQMNPQFHVRAYEHKACTETENIFDDDFYESLDMVCTALDNIDARLYIDNRCLFYHKPLLESGTLGSKGNTQIVVPRITEHYGATTDPPEQSFPICTIKSFPNLIEHTIQWGREKFEEIFTQTSANCSMFSQDPEDWYKSLSINQNTKKDALVMVEEAVVVFRPDSLESCIRWARIKFEEFFNHSIQQLIYTYPLDKVIVTGNNTTVPFWSGGKRPPSPLVFDLNDESHVEFVQSLALLRASMFGLEVPVDAIAGSVLPGSNKIVRGIRKELVAEALNNFEVPRFQPKEDVKIAVTEEEAKAESKESDFDIDAKCEGIFRSLRNVKGLTHVSPIEFEKDFDDHMRVVASMSNLRARNYRIPEVDMLKSRGIAGKIMPAIATTTALVVGYICMEIFKLRQNIDSIGSYRNGYFNLAIPIFASMQPEPPQNKEVVVMDKPWKWNQWDRIDIQDPSMTVKKFVEHMEDEYGLDVVMISSGVSMIYSTIFPSKKLNERKAMDFKTLVETVSKSTLPATQKYVILELTAENANGDTVEIPYIRVRIR